MTGAIRRPILYRIAWVCLMSAVEAEASNPCSSLPAAHVVGSSLTAPPVAKETLTVASLNMAGQARIEDVLTGWTRDRLIDILLLQEVGDASFDGGAFVAALSERLGFHFTYAPANVLGDTHTQGLAIVSRYPLSDVHTLALTYHRLRFKTRCRIALAATANTAEGPLRLINVHLDTRINSEDRVAQLAPVLEALDSVDGPQIIGGDFNTMNIGWFRTMWPFPYVQRQSAAVRRLLASAGFRTPLTDMPPTFRFLGIPLRLDWLYLKDVVARGVGVDAVRFTDHRAVWTQVSDLSRR